jgi:uncharacterized membrane protein YdjX (TVP38/TMEM64 family)
MLNILISIAGIIPSVFITAANITVFGFHTGLVISYIGELMGAIVSFWLYRKGIQTINLKTLNKNKWLVKLQNTKGWDTFYMIVMLRILPFVPSGMVNLASAISRTTLLTFIAGSSLGKLPSLIIEAYSVNQVLEASTNEKAFLIMTSLIIFIIYIIKKYLK